MHKTALHSNLAVVLLLLTAPVLPALDVTENFFTNPLSTNRWTFGVGSNASTQFVYQSSAPAFDGDTPGSLLVHVNSALPTARLDLSLGTTLTDTADFTVQTQFSMSNIVTNSSGGMQIAFGLVNHSLTGGDRTSSDTTSGDAFHTVEFNYFPNVNQAYNYPGPTLSPTVIGGDNGGGLFSNFATLFNDASDLGLNPPDQIHALSQNVNLQATLAYTASTKTLSLQVAQIGSDGSLTILSTGVPALNLVAAGYDATHPFTVDSLAVMSYKDGYPQYLDGYPDFTDTPSSALTADVTFQKLRVTSPAPEPTATVLLIGAMLLGAARVRPRFNHLRRV